MSYKPAGYPSVSPYLTVQGARATLAFLVEVFDARTVCEVPADDGSARLRHAEVRLDDSVLMLCDATESWQPAPSHVHVYVADVDATYRRALAAGAQPVQEPVRHGDPDRRGGFTDPGGTTWWVATRQA